MTVVLLDTSTPLCRLSVVVDGDSKNYSWQADRNLARDLLSFLIDKLSENNKTLKDINAIGFMKGPGSFTGLRIGATIANTLVDDLKIPIVGVEQSDDWQQEAVARLEKSENDQMIMPFYGNDPHITQPRK